MAERRASVVALAGGRVELVAEGACSDCGGCGGRCNLFAGAAGGDRLSLPLEGFPRRPHPGERVRLSLPDGWLARSALAGYGLPLAGLVAGCALGAPFGDAPAILGSALGLLAGLRASRRVRPRMGVHFAAAPAGPIIQEHTPGVSS